MKPFPFFQGLRPLRWPEVPRNLVAGVTLAAMNVLQSLGYTRIAGMLSKGFQGRKTQADELRLPSSPFAKSTSIS